MCWNILSGCARNMNRFSESVVLKYQVRETQYKEIGHSWFLCRENSARCNIALESLVLAKSHDLSTICATLHSAAGNKVVRQPINRLDYMTSRISKLSLTLLQ